jgi:hypothetical protein
MSAQEIAQALTELLKTLAQMAEPAMAHLWAVMVWGTIVEGIVRFGIGFVVFVVGLIFTRQTMKNWHTGLSTLDPNSIDGKSPSIVLGYLIIASIAVPVSIVMMLASLKWLLAPEYMLIFNLLSR